MKSFLLLLIFLSSSSFKHIYGQSIVPLVGNSYIADVGHNVVYGITKDAKKDSAHYFFVSKGTRFNVIGFSADKDLIVVFWDYKLERGEYIDSSAADYFRSYPSNCTGRIIKAWANKKEFILPLESFSSTCKMFYGGKTDFSWGAITLPIKIKFGKGSDRNFDIEENLNLGFGVGARKQIPSKHLQGINYLFLCSMGRVKADSASLGKYIPNGSTSMVPYPTPSTGIASALSAGLGCVYQYESSFQIGLFFGLDHVVGEIGNHWKYQGKPWLGIAFGISLFNQSNAQTGTTGTNTAAAIK